MGKLFGLRSTGGRLRGVLLVSGLVLIVLGVALLLGAQAQASDGPFTVRPEASDLALFGKPLSNERPVFRSWAQTELKPGIGPVVPARLRIPALGIDTAVEETGTFKGNMDVPDNIWEAAWLKTGPRPGDRGNAVIAGHKDSTRGTAIFWDLGKLKAGDRVYVSDQYGWELTFEVTEVQSYAREAAPLDRIFGPGNENRLNLITCDGNFQSDQLTYDKRLVVFTRLVPDTSRLLKD